MRNSFEPAKPTLVISFDSPFLDLVPLLADASELCHVHVPHGTARLQAPNQRERLDYEHEAFPYARSCNTFVGTISQHMAEHLVADYGVAQHKLMPLHSGVLLDEHERCSQDEIDQALKTVGLASGEQFLLSFGRAERYKGFHVLLEAFTLLLDSPSLVLLTALVDPRHEYVRYLESFAASRSLPVHFLTRFDVWLPCVLQQADTLLGVVVPSLVEPFGLIVTEVLTNPYCQAPIICSRVGGMVEQVMDGEIGFTFSVGNAADLAATISEVIHMTTTERQDMKERALAGQDRFNIVKNVSMFLASVEERMSLS